MTVLEGIGLVVSVGLLAYLFYAMLYPDKV